MSDEELTYTQKIIYSPKFNWDECSVGNWYSHRENINSALWEFSSRNEETRKICFSFGNPIIITGNVHYSKDSIGKSDSHLPHFNIDAGGKTFHIYVTKNHRRIVQISEMTLTKHPF